MIIEVTVWDYFNHNFIKFKKNSTTREQFCPSYSKTPTFHLVF